MESRKVDAKRANWSLLIMFSLPDVFGTYVRGILLPHRPRMLHAPFVQFRTTSHGPFSLFGIQKVSITFPFSVQYSVGNKITAKLVQLFCGATLRDFWTCILCAGFVSADFARIFKFRLCAVARNVEFAQYIDGSFLCGISLLEAKMGYDSQISAKIGNMMPRSFRDLWGAYRGDVSEEPDLGTSREDQ
ncbi:hypothetical protein B0H13DRAFT_1901057 [Mycena leptocephala]|nr:hypothetical protein B0H13DRAFT_1901057 [Mycena leptocephala]